NNNVEYSFIVSPNGNAGAITLDFSGYATPTINDLGQLVLTTAGGRTMLESAPTSAQQTASGWQAVSANFVLLGNDQVGIAVGTHDSALPLVIDPIISSTYLGGSGTDTGEAVAADKAGDVFVTGGTSSANFPASAGAFQATFAGTQEAFVAEFSPTG